MAATGSGGDSDPGGTFYRPRAAPRRRGDVEVVGGGCGVVGATGRGDEGVVGEVAWLWENVRTHAEDAERLWRTLTRFGDGGCGAGSAKTKATETKAWGPRVSGTEAGAARAEADARSWAASGPRARKGGWAEGIRPEAEIEILKTFSI